MIISASVCLPAQNPNGSLTNTKIDGYRGIWFELNQKLPYGDKYSGGLGTYTAKHMPMAIYVENVDRTYFVYGGTTHQDEKHLLCMIGYYDHEKKLLSQPTVVFDKIEVDDPHDNPSLLIDDTGYLWVFVSGRGTIRPGFKLRSDQPYSIKSFTQISEEELTYPQPWFHSENGFFHFFTKYSGTRELYFETSEDGITWSTDKKISGIIEEGYEKAGHYQVTGKFENKFGTFFNRHQDGHPDTRTDLYYVETLDFGKTWQSVQGFTLSLPLTTVNNPAKIHGYQAEGKNVYMKDMRYDDMGNPICLYLTSRGFAPGPDNQPYEWKISKWIDHTWETITICESDHNYDMGSLYLMDSSWYVIGPTEVGPQEWAAGGEIAIWSSKDYGLTWKKEKEITQNSKFNHTYVRRPLHAKEPFLYYWADGDPSVFSQSNIYFGDLDGNIWQLPYQMDEPFEKPKQVNLK